MFTLWNWASAQKPYTLSVQFDSAEINTPRKQRITHDTKFASPQERHKAISRILLTLYDQGFLQAEADSVGGDSLHLSVNIQRGNKFKDAIIRTGNLDPGMMPNAVYRDKLLYNEPFSPQRVAVLFKKILAQYENNGYPFVSVRPDSVEISAEQVKMSIWVDKGPAVVMDSIVIRGNANIKRAFLHGYLGMKPGSVYSEKQIRSINNRLKQLPFITVERPHRVEFSSPEKAKVIIYAKKVNASRFNGLIGFMPGSSNSGKLLITGEADLGLWNALGYGEQFSLKWRRIQAGTQSLNVYAKYPYLFGTPLALNGNFDFYRRDSTFQNITFGFGVQYQFIGTSYIELFYRRQIAQVINVEKFVSSAQLPESIDFTANNVGIKFNFENYDYRWNPTRGYLIHASVWGGIKNMRRAKIPEQLYDGLQLRSYQVGGEFKIDYFIRLHKRIALKPGAMLAHSVNPYRFLNELYRVGGISNLRGFDEDSYYISSYAFGNLELRYLIEKNSNVYLFFNGGWAERDIVTGYMRDNPYGFGAGINFFTKAGYINFAYALGSSQGQPIQFKNGKIHLGFTGVF